MANPLDRKLENQKQPVDFPRDPGIKVYVCLSRMKRCKGCVCGLFDGTSVQRLTLWWIGLAVWVFLEIGVSQNGGPIWVGTRHKC